MTRYWLFLLFLVAAVFCIRIPAADEDEKDPVHDALGQAKSVYKEDISKAKTTLLGVFDGKFQEVAKTGNLEAVKSLQAEKKAYETDGKLPTSQVMKKAVAEYQSSIDGAHRAMSNAYATAMSDYTKGLQIEKADAVNNEFESFKRTGGAKEEQASAKKPLFEYKFYEWKLGDAPIKMIHKDEGFCYLTVINGNFSGGGSTANVEIKDDGYWYLWGASGPSDQGGYERLRAVAVKINVPSQTQQEQSESKSASAEGGGEANKLKDLLTSKPWFLHWEEQPPTRDHLIRFLPNGHTEAADKNLSGDWAIVPVLAVKYGGNYLIRVDEKKLSGLLYPNGKASRNFFPINSAVLFHPIGAEPLFRLPRPEAGAAIGLGCPFGARTNAA